MRRLQLPGSLVCLELKRRILVRTNPRALRFPMSIGHVGWTCTPLGATVSLPSESRVAGLLVLLRRCVCVHV